MVSRARALICSSVSPFGPPYLTLFHPQSAFLSGLSVLFRRRDQADGEANVPSTPQVTPPSDSSLALHVFPA